MSKAVEPLAELEMLRARVIVLEETLRQIGLYLGFGGSDIGEVRRAIRVVLKGDEPNA